MTRSDFLKSIIAGATAVKAVGETLPDGAAPKAKRLLAIEIDQLLSNDERACVKHALAHYEERYGVEFLLLCAGMRIVDPAAPAVTSHTHYDVAASVDPERAASQIFRALSQPTGA